MNTALLYDKSRKARINHAHCIAALTEWAHVHGDWIVTGRRAKTSQDTMLITLCPTPLSLSAQTTSAFFPQV